MRCLASGRRNLHRLRAIAFGAIVCAGLLYAWEFEQVDTVGRWSMVRIQRASDGRPYIIYNAYGTGRLHIAWKDSCWHRDTLPFSSNWFDFKIGPRGRMGITLGDGRYAERSDSGWVSTSVGAGWLAFDSDDDPFVTWIIGLRLDVLKRTDTVWGVAQHVYMPSLPGDELRGVYGLDMDRLGNLSVFYAYQFGYHMPTQVRIVAMGWNDGGERYTVAGSSQAPLADSGVMIAYRMAAPDSLMWLYCGNDRIELESANAIPAVVRADTWNHLHLVYAAGSLTYAYKPLTFWHKETVGV